MVGFHIAYGIKDYDDAVDEMAKQDDRGVAIVATALLEDHLLSAIKSRFSQRSEIIEGQFMKGYGPLASLKSRIDLGYFLGFYGEECHHRLMRVKEIRNRMAHRIKPHHFHTQEIKDQLAHLPNREALLKSWEHLKLFFGRFEATEQDRSEGLDAINKACAGLQSYTSNGRGDFLAYIQNRCMAFMFVEGIKQGENLDFLYSAHL